MCKNEFLGQLNNKELFHLALIFFSHFHADANASFRLNSDFHPKILLALFVSA